MCADDHVHVSDGVVAALHSFKKIPKTLKLHRITNVDWGAPAINYKGRWVRVPVEVIESVWPLIKDRIVRSRTLDPPEEQENNQEIEKESEE